MGKGLNLIKVVLAEHSKTNRWFAGELGIGEATVSKWCTNTCQPTIETMIKIAKLLNIEMNELFWYSKQ